VDVGKVRVGQAVEIESDSIIGEILGGEVVEVAPVIKTLGSTRTSTVLVDIREIPASVDLKAGASCTARIVTNVKEGSVVIPLSGFIEQSSTTYAYVMKPEEKRGDREFYRLEKTEIKTGISNVNFIEITDGLSVGDRIVVGNLTLFRDGILVALKEDS
jgi:HlyD family secretion protein